MKKTYIYSDLRIASILMMIAVFTLVILLLITGNFSVQSDQVKSLWIILLIIAIVISCLRLVREIMKKKYR